MEQVPWKILDYRQSSGAETLVSGGRSIKTEWVYRCHHI